MSATGWLLASSTTIASNRSVNPASRPRPRHRDRVHAVGGARHARHARVNERLVLEEDQMPPHALPRVMHRTRGLAAPRFRAGEPRNPPRTRSRYAVPVCRPPRHGTPRPTPSTGQAVAGRRWTTTWYPYPQTTRPAPHPRPTHPHQTAKGLKNYYKKASKLKLNNQLWSHYLGVEILLQGKSSPPN